MGGAGLQKVCCRGRRFTLVVSSEENLPGFFLWDR